MSEIKNTKVGSPDHKVLLVHPPLQRLYPSAGEDSRRHRLEPLSLEMILSDNPYGIPADIYDMDVYPEEEPLRFTPEEVKATPSMSRFEAVLESQRPTIIGITVNTPLVYEAKQIARVARRVLGNPFIVVGGNHVHNMPEHSIEYIRPDAVWQGDADNFLRLLGDINFTEEIRSGRVHPVIQKAHIEGRVGPKEPKVKKGDDRFRMDNLNFPVRHRPEDYFFTTMQTSRGCLWRCVYCGSADRGMVWRSPENILEELDALQKTPFKYSDDNTGEVVDTNLLAKKIYFLDDCFLDSRTRARDLLRGIAERGYSPALRFWAETRADTIHPDIMELARAAGCYQITFGLESGNQEVLDSLQKKVDLDRVERALKIVSDHGISVRANFMIGHLDETEAQILDTIHYAESLQERGLASTVAFYKVLPLPGTPLYREVVARGIPVDRDFADFAWYGKTVSRMSRVDPERLDELHAEAYKRLAKVSNKDRKNVDY